MSKLLITGIKYMRRGKHIVSDAQHGIGGIRCSILPCVMAALLLFSVMLPLTVQAASEQDPRLAAIAADAAAGVDIVTIIQNAVAAGLTVERAVEAIVTAGVDPGRVAYVSIVANYTATDVVCGDAKAVTKMGLSATEFQAQMTLIVSTALQAGATESQVNSGLTCGGVSANVIANAFAQASQSPAPVFGYTAPITPARPLTTVIGTTGVPIGGGSGTKPASPTKPK